MAWFLWQRAGTCAVLFGCSLALVLSLALADEFRLSEGILSYVADKHGGFARRRLLEWQELINSNRNRSDLQKLEIVNDFFNERIIFISDSRHWGREDYWATPVETLATKGGDCEDFVIAKYFTLREMGMADDRLRLTYVTSTRLRQPHMVLTYYATPDAEPLVLDNVTRRIEPASSRSDLNPVYSFNGEGLWMAKERGRGNLVGSASRVGAWRDVLLRMDDERRR